MRNCNFSFFICLTFFGTLLLPSLQSQTEKYQIEYTVNVPLDAYKNAQKIGVWMPVPAQGDLQTVETNLQFSGSEDTEISFAQNLDDYGNTILYADIKIKEVRSRPCELTFIYTIERKAAHANLAQFKWITPSEEDKKFLRSSKLVPIGHPAVQSLIAKALPENQALNQMQNARALYEYLVANMKYDKSGTGWGHGDAVWACQNQRGNCSDFHAAFIAAMRTLGVPAYFEIGFAIPPDSAQGEISGYHCWAWFYGGLAGWIPVDISEASKNPERQEFFFGNLDAQRVAFSIERDIALLPSPQSFSTVNFFIAPAVEIDDRKSEQFTTKVSYQRLSQLPK